MKRLLITFSAAAMMLACGCQLAGPGVAQNGCQGGCNGGSCGNGYLYGSPNSPGFLDLMHAQRRQNAYAGPPAPTYGYPYYTTRGPRDFLVDNPPSIGR
jgi:hypothetical protein